MKRFGKLIILVIEFGLLFLYMKCGVSVPCMIKSFTGFRCPTCGMTRAIMAIFKGNVIESISFNIMGIPLVILLIIMDVLVIIDVIGNKKYLNRFWIRFSKGYVVLILVFVISMIVNNIRGI